MRISRLKSTVTALLFAGIFVFLCFDLVNDERTYISPPTYTQAEDQVSSWLTALGMAKRPDPALEARKEHLAHYMASAARYRVHYTLLFLILSGYLISAYLVWKRYASAVNAVMITFLLKIFHGFYFVGMGYYGKKASAALIGAAPPPVLALNPNEMHYLSGIVLSLLILSYFFLLKKRQREHAAILRF